MLRGVCAFVTIHKPVDHHSLQVGRSPQVYKSVGSVSFNADVRCAKSARIRKSRVEKRLVAVKFDEYFMLESRPRVRAIRYITQT
jgi:hypothetical protein